MIWMRSETRRGSARGLYGNLPLPRIFLLASISHLHMKDRMKERIVFSWKLISITVWDCGEVAGGVTAAGIEKGAIEVGRPVGLEPLTPCSPIIYRLVR